MNLTQARDVLLTQVTSVFNTHLAGIPLHVQNGPMPNMDTVGDVFVVVSYVVLNRRQSELAINPNVRTNLDLAFTIFRKDGSGSRQTTELADTLDTHLSNISLSGVHTLTLTVKGRESRQGWYSERWVLPAWFDSKA